MIYSVSYLEVVLSYVNQEIGASEGETDPKEFPSGDLPFSENFKPTSRADFFVEVANEIQKAIDNGGLLSEVGEWGINYVLEVCYYDEILGEYLDGLLIDSGHDEATSEALYEEIFTPEFIRIYQTFGVLYQLSKSVLKSSVLRNFPPSSERHLSLSFCQGDWGVSEQYLNNFIQMSQAPFPSWIFAADTQLYGRVARVSSFKVGRISKPSESELKMILGAEKNWVFVQRTEGYIRKVKIYNLFHPEESFEFDFASESIDVQRCLVRVAEKELLEPFNFEIELPVSDELSSRRLPFPDSPFPFVLFRQDCGMLDVIDHPLHSDARDWHCGRQYTEEFVFTVRGREASLKSSDFSVYRPLRPLILDVCEE